MKRIVFIDIISVNDIDTNRVRLTACEKRKDSIHIVKDIEIEGTFSGEINNLLKGAEVYLSLPVHMLGLRIMEFPFSDQKRINEVLPYELSQTILENIDEVVFDIVEANNRDNTTDVLVAYARRKEIEDIIKILNLGDINISVITSMGLSSMRPLLRNLKSLTRDISYNDYSDRYISLVQDEIRRPILNIGKKEILRSIEYERISKRLRLTTYLLVILTFFVIINFGLRIFYNLRSADEMESMISSKFRMVFPHESIKSSSLQLKSHIKELKEKESIFSGVKVLDIMKSMKLSEGIFLNEIRIENGMINLRGEASELRYIESYRDLLSRTFSDVNIVETKQLSGKINFMIRAEHTKKDSSK